MIYCNLENDNQMCTLSNLILSEHHFTRNFLNLKKFPTYDELYYFVSLFRNQLRNRLFNYSVY